MISQSRAVTKLPYLFFVYFIYLVVWSTVQLEHTLISKLVLHCTNQRAQQDYHWQPKRNNTRVSDWNHLQGGAAIQRIWRICTTGVAHVARGRKGTRNSKTIFIDDASVLNSESTVPNVDETCKDEC